GSRCTTTTNAALVLLGSSSNSCCSARTPPAEAPMPTTTGLGAPGPEISSRSSSLISAISLSHLPLGDGIWSNLSRVCPGSPSSRLNFGTNHPGRVFPLWGTLEHWMANRDILAIGTSAGGFAALRFLAGEFSPDFPASILVVIHLSSQFRSTLDAILTQEGPLQATFAVEGEKLKRGHIYIAPPERHLLVESDELRLGLGPRENNARPALDPLF